MGSGVTSGRSAAAVCGTSLSRANPKAIQDATLPTIYNRTHPIATPTNQPTPPNITTEIKNTHTHTQNPRPNEKKTMAEPRARVRQKGQVFSSDDRTSPIPSILPPKTPQTNQLTNPPSLLSQLPPCSLRRPSTPPPRHNRHPRQHPNRLHNRNVPLRGALSLLLAPAEDQSRRFQIRSQAR